MNPLESVDLNLCTQKRLKVTIRKPKNLSLFGSSAHVVLELEDGSGLAVAVLGTDDPISRANAVKICNLWNKSIAN